MCRAENLTTFMCQLSRYSESFNLFEPSRPAQVSVGIALPIHIKIMILLNVIMTTVR